MSSSSEFPIKYITSDPSYYAECFRVFRRLSSRYQVFNTWAETVFPRKVVEKISIKSLDENPGKLAMLGAGSGSGELESKLISQLLKKFPSISSTVVEPHQEHITSYKELVEHQGFRGVDWDWRQQTWEQFYDERTVQSDGKQKKFHFISVIHSLYHIMDIESAILNLMSCLYDGGILMIILLSEHGSECLHWKRFPMLADGKSQRITAVDARSILEKHQIGFEAVTQESNVDITCCYEDGNQDGVMLADFISHVKLRESAPQSFVDEVLSHMRECAVQNGDRILFNNDWQAIFVTK